MREIVGKKAEVGIVGINELLVDSDKIYAYKINGKVRVLVKYGNHYYWSGLCVEPLGYGGGTGYRSYTKAIEDAVNREFGSARVFEFSDQCELRDWAVKV